MSEETQEGIIEHESGIEFLRPTGEYAGISRPGIMSFGKLLNRPQFTDLNGFREALSTLDRVITRPVFLDGGRQVEGFHAVQSEVSDVVYSIPTTRYHIVQDEEVFRPLYDYINETNIKPIGRFDGVGTGRTNGHIILANPKFKVQLLQEYDDYIMLGVRAWNSYNRETTFGAEVFGVRMVCVNYNLWGDILGKFKFTHKSTCDIILERYNFLIKTMLDNIPILQNLCRSAFGTEIPKSEIEDLLWGAKMPIGCIDAMLDKPTQYEPMIEKLGINAWTLYNACTAYLTHARVAGATLVNTERYAKDAVNILRKDEHTKLIESGRERKLGYYDMLKKMQEKREKKKMAVEVRQVA